MSNHVREFLKSRSIQEDIELNEYVVEAINILEDCDSLVREAIYKNLDSP